MTIRQEILYDKFSDEWSEEWFKMKLNLPMHIISMLSHITWNTIIKNLDKSWDWPNISKNPNITFEIIKNNPNYPWNWNCVTRNPNISINIVKKHIFP